MAWNWERDRAASPKVNRHLTHPQHIIPPAPQNSPSAQTGEVRNEVDLGRLGGDKSSLAYPPLVLAVIVQFGDRAGFYGDFFSSLQIPTETVVGFGGILAYAILYTL